MRKIYALIICTMVAVTTVAAQPPRLRTSGKNKKEVAQAKKNDTQQQSTAAVNPFAMAAATSNRYMALKTNLVYDIFAVLNLAYEVEVAKKWSVEIPVDWSLWDWTQQKGVRTVTLQPGAKYWFDRAGEGSALGLNADISWFNVRWHDYRYQESRPALGASIFYSYLLNLGRGWKAEFLLGVGYVNLKYNKYYNIDNGALIQTKSRNYFGPTRIGISLAYKL